MLRNAPLLLTSLLAFGCTSEPDDGADAGPSKPDQACKNAGTPGATARCLSPTQSPDYYADEANKYFDTLDIDADRARIPTYSALVARWEWPPWLLLTGYTRENLIETADVLRDADPSTVPVRDCRGFAEQPFARCYVVFEYEEGPCPIYEEFTFNDLGEMTFIEAWSDREGMRPTLDDSDRWAESLEIPRLSTRVPGLGNAEGLIDLDSAWMKSAGRQDSDVADFALRAGDFWKYWLDALKNAPPGYFARGCGW